EPLGEIGADEVLRLAASLERGSEHPLASAAVRAAEERNLSLVAPQSFEAIPGKGVIGNVEGRSVCLGSPDLLQEHGVPTDTLSAKVQEHRTEGRTVLLLAVDGQLAGLLAVADPVRQTTPEALSLLRQDGLRILMLTGDSKTTAEAVARRLGIDEVIAEV